MELFNLSDKSFDSYHIITYLLSFIDVFIIDERCELVLNHDNLRNDGEKSILSDNNCEYLMIIFFFSKH